MDKLKSSAEKLCSFYISDWHMVTMLLPYINKELNEKANIVTFLENNIEENIRTLMSKLNLKNEKKILEINWDNTDIKNTENIKEGIKELKSEVRNIILVKGCNKYIEKVNELLERQLKENKNGRLKIVNCYEIADFNGNINDVLNIHDKVLNTAGEKSIEEVFEGYSKINNVS